MTDQSQPGCHVDDLASVAAHDHMLSHCLGTEKTPLRFVSTTESQSGSATLLPGLGALHAHAPAFACMITYNLITVIQEKSCFSAKIWHQNAIEQFRLLHISDPDSAPIHMSLGEVLDAANQEEEATAEFETAVKVSPHEPDAHFGLGYMYWKQRRFEDASREFRAELADQPQHTQALTYLGDAEMHRGKDQEARAHLQQALKLDAKVRLAHLDLGIVLAAQKDKARAESHLREAIRLDPSNPDAHYRLGKLLSSVGREKEAEAEYAKVKALARTEQAPPLISVPGRKGQPIP